MERSWHCTKSNYSMVAVQKIVHTFVMLYFHFCIRIPENDKNTLKSTWTYEEIPQSCITFGGVQNSICVPL